LIYSVICTMLSQTLPHVEKVRAGQST
jgi:hypothetical protein